MRHHGDENESSISLHRKFLPYPEAEFLRELAGDELTVKAGVKVGHAFLLTSSLQFALGSRECAVKPHRLHGERASLFTPAPSCSSPVRNMASLRCISRNSWLPGGLPFIHPETDANAICTGTAQPFFAIFRSRSSSWLGLGIASSKAQLMECNSAETAESGYSWLRREESKARKPPPSTMPLIAGSVAFLLQRFITACCDEHHCFT